MLEMFYDHPVLFSNWKFPPKYNFVPPKYISLKGPYVWYESFIGKIKESKSLLFERSQLSRENQWGWTIQYGPYSNLIAIYILGCKIFHFLEVSNYNPKPNVSLIYKKATFLENVSLLWIRWNSLNVQKEIQTVKVG